MTGGFPQDVRIGVISDTHGSLSQQAQDELQGVDAIVHAGDIGAAWVLCDLAAIAPVHAVLGNTDHVMPGWDLSALDNFMIGGYRVFVVHDIHSTRVPEDVDIVVHGHTHRTTVDVVEGVLYVNPGSASRSRGDGHTLAIIDLPADGEPVVEFRRFD